MKHAERKELKLDLIEKINALQAQIAAASQQPRVPERIMQGDYFTVCGWKDAIQLSVTRRVKYPTLSRSLKELEEIEREETNFLVQLI